MDGVVGEGGGKSIRVLSEPEREWLVARISGALDRCLSFAGLGTVVPFSLGPLSS